MPPTRCARGRYTHGFRATGKNADGYFMNQSASAVTAPAAAPADHMPSLWSRVSYFLARRRLAISAALFAALIVEDVLTGVIPHDILAWRDPWAELGCWLIVA